MKFKGIIADVIWPTIKWNNWATECCL